MNSNDMFRFNNTVVGYPITFVLIIWIVFWAEIRFGFRLNYLGIEPETFIGLRGVFLSPFIHADISHLYHNSLPLLVLSSALFYFYKPVAWKVLGMGIIVSGVLTWIIAKNGVHIGASGLVYVLMSFMLFRGIISKHYRLMALSFLVIFIYGSMFWYVFPIKENISWEGHLSGLITGIVFSLVFTKTSWNATRFDWEKSDYDSDLDPFMKHFDSNGNFIESKEEE